MSHGRHRGISLLEIVMAMAITLLVTLALFTALNQTQRRYRGEQILTEVGDGIRSAGELLAQEIALAGHHGLQTRRLVNASAASASAQAVEFDDASGIFVGQRLLVDVGDPEEIVEVTAVAGANVTGIFRRDHVAGTPVNATGPFSTGVLPGSNATTLQMYGDLHDNGDLIFVEYRVAGGALTRSETPIGASLQAPAEVILPNVVANPAATPVFQYQTQTVSGRTFVTQVTVTLSAETAALDPELGALRTQTVSFSVNPRNLRAAHTLAQVRAGDRLQPQPPGLPIPVTTP